MNRAAASCGMIASAEAANASGALKAAPRMNPIATRAIKQTDGAYAIDDALCVRCDACRELAPEAVRVVDAPVDTTPDLRIHLQDVGRDARGRMN